LFALTSLTACNASLNHQHSEGEPPSESPGTGATHVSRPKYVALGDSYTASPGTGTIADQDGCFRSAGSYPEIIARKLHLDLTNVSCSGATTIGILAPQLSVTRVRRPAQITALTRTTKFVTVGIGINDFDFYRRISSICPALDAAHPGTAACAEADRQAPPAARLAALITALQTRATRVLRKVTKRAPRAEVLVIGYPDVIPAHGTCAELPLAPGDARFARRIFTGVNRALDGAATETGARYLDVARATSGHGICSGSPWVAGITSDPRKGVPWHPYAPEQRAVARLIARAFHS